MPTVHHPGNPQGRFQTWQHWRAITCYRHQTPPTPPPPPPPPWRPCPTCWGQGRIFEHHDDGLTSTTCQTCLGIATIPST